MAHGRKCNFISFRCKKCRIKNLEEKVELLQASLKTQSTSISALHQILINQHSAIERLEASNRCLEARLELQLRLGATENAPPVYKPRTE